MKTLYTFLCVVMPLLAMGQTVRPVQHSNGAVVSPTNFWSADAVNARAGLGLGTAATNSANAFQPASAALMNLAGGVFPDNLLRTNGSAAGLTNFPTLNQNTTGTAANVTGVVALANGGTGATNGSNARVALGLGATWLTNTNVAIFRGAIGLGTGSDPEFNSVNVGTVYATDVATYRLDILGRTLELGEDDQLTLYGGGLAFSSTTNAAITRTNLGLGDWATLSDGANVRVQNLTISDGEQLDYIQFTAGGGVQFYGNRASEFRAALGLGATWLTNTNATNFRTAIGALATNGSAATLTNFPSELLRTNGTLAITNITGLQSALDGKLATNGSIAASQVTNFSNAVVAVAPPTTNAALLTSGTLDDARLSTNAASALTNARAVAWVSVPSATNANGQPGQMAYATNHVYICVATNTWRRVQLGTW